MSTSRPTSRALPIALLRTREHVMGPIRPLLAKLGVTEQKWRILRILAEAGPMEQTGIAREACLLLPSLTRILRAMQADGLITKQQDKADARRSIVAITNKGRALIAGHAPASEAVYKRLEDQLGRDKLEQLLDLLEAVQEIDF